MYSSEGSRSTANQAEPLLTTKLSVPHPRADCIARKRLLRSPDAGMSIRDDAFACKLTLLAAPAGYGKPTLLAEWVAGTDIPVA